MQHYSLTSEVDSRGGDHDGEDHGEADADEPPPLGAAGAVGALPDAEAGVGAGRGRRPGEQGLLRLAAHILQKKKIEAIGLELEFYTYVPPINNATRASKLSYLVGFL